MADNREDAGEVQDAREIPYCTKKEESEQKNGKGRSKGRRSQIKGAPTGQI